MVLASAAKSLDDWCGRANSSTCMATALELKVLWRRMGTANSRTSVALLQLYSKHLQLSVGRSIVALRDVANPNWLVECASTLRPDNRTSGADDSRRLSPIVASVRSTPYSLVGHQWHCTVDRRNATSRRWILACASDYVRTERYTSKSRRVVSDKLSRFLFCLLVRVF